MQRFWLLQFWLRVRRAFMPGSGLRESIRRPGWKEVIGTVFVALFGFLLQVAQIGRGTPSESSINWVFVGGVTILAFAASWIIGVIGRYEAWVEKQTALPVIDLREGVRSGLSAILVTNNGAEAVFGGSFRIREYGPGTEIHDWMTDWYPVFWETGKSQQPRLLSTETDWFCFYRIQEHRTTDGIQYFDVRLGGAACGREGPHVTWHAGVMTRSDMWIDLEITVNTAPQGAAKTCRRLYRIRPDRYEDVTASKLSPPSTAR